VKGTAHEGLLGDNGIELFHGCGYHEVWEDVVQMKKANITEKEHSQKGQTHHRAVPKLMEWG